MKYLISLILVLTCTSYASANSSCSEEAPRGSECEIVRTVTRCDVEKQKLRSRIAVLERRVKELESRTYTVQTLYIERTKVEEKQVIKHHIISLYAAKDIESINASQSGGSATVDVKTQYEPGIKYQYQFNFGLVPEIGINIKGNPLFGLGFEF